MATTTTTTTGTENLHLSTQPKASSSPPTQGLFRYIPSGVTPEPSPHLYHLPPLSTFSDVRSLPLHDIRPTLHLGDASPYSLDKHGFTARHHPSKLHSPPYTHSDWSNNKLLREIYFPEVVSLVKHIAGCKEVVIEEAILRTALHTEVDSLATSEDKKDEGSGKGKVDVPDDDNNFPQVIGIDGGVSPAPKVHLDFAPAGARSHIRNYHPNLTAAGKQVIDAEDRVLARLPPGEEGEEQLKHHYDGPRWAMFSVWRPVKPVKRDPLALSDCSTFPRADYVPIDITLPTRRAAGDSAADVGVESHKEKSFLARCSQKDGHRWHWISDQLPEEVLVIQLFDSEMERQGHGVAGGVMHSSVVLEGVDETERDARESLETRCTVFW